LSFIGAASIFFPVPYSVVLLAISATRQFNPILLAVSAGLGSAVGEMVGYGLGYMGRGIVSKNRESRLNAMMRIFNRFGAAAVFVFALTPLPDDLLLIPLGLLRYKFWKVFVPCIAGKFLMFLAIAYIGGVLGQWYIGNPIFAVLAFALLVLVAVAMFRIDWVKVESTLVKRGKEIKRNIERLTELGITLGVYGITTFLAFETAMRVEWYWRGLQFILPIAALLILQRPPQSLGLTFKGIFKGTELGVLAGVLLAICLAPFYLILITPKLEVPFTFFGFGSAALLTVSDVIAMEIFYRGYMQSQFVAIIGRYQGLIATAILAGFDFREFKILDPGKVGPLLVLGFVFIAVAALLYGFLYQRTKTLAAPIAAHVVFLLLLTILLSS
jgi:membrane protein YqaA with SNARE-associated domain/membrane protease YdiL (CAAX protease family)